MKFSVMQKPFLDALTHLQRAVPNTTTLSYLYGVRIRAEGTTVTLETSDMIKRITIKLFANVEQSGEAVAVDVKRLRRQIDTFSNERVDVRITGTKLEFKSGRSKFKTAYVEEFLSDVDITQDIGDVDIEALQYGVGVCMPSVANNDSRPALAGVHFQSSGTEIKFAAADGITLSTCKIVGEFAPEGVDYVIPGDSMQVFSKLTSGMEGTAHIDVSDNMIRFTMIGDEFVESTALTSNLISQRFPDYEQIIPKTITTSVEMDTDAFRDAIDAVNRLDKTGVAILEVDGPTLTVEISTLDEERVEELIVSNVYDTQAQISTMPSQLLTILKTVNQERVRLNINSPTAPYCIVPVREEDAISIMHVIMPMHVRSRVRMTE